MINEIINLNFFEYVFNEGAGNNVPPNVDGNLHSFYLPNCNQARNSRAFHIGVGDGGYYVLFSRVAQGGLQFTSENIDELRDFLKNKDFDIPRGNFYIGGNGNRYTYFFVEEIKVNCFIDTISNIFNIERKPEANMALEGDKRQGDSMNLIIYGPPGTGKTFSLIGLVKKIKAYDAENYESIAEISRDLDKKSQLLFITFHQSYSYEDFVEGIKAEVTQNGQVNYAIKNGVFKNLCRRAYLHKLVSLADFDVDQETVDKMLDFYADKTDSEIKLKNCDLSKLILNVIGGDKFIASNESTPKYVICIDEINRGNLSRIFGELITCVEVNKRHGADEPIEVTLPGSGDKFIVPDNLYIIGTMNTADRSLVKFDNAMRRRFDFEYIGPDSTLVPEPYRESFKALNRNIRIKLTKDFEIGHAYFMGIKDDKQFEAVVRKKVIPLLEEYFFDNPDAINEITAGTMFENFLREDN